MKSPIASNVETALYVDNIDAANAFYNCVLGLEKFAHAGSQYIFSAGGSSVRFLLNPALAVKPAAAGTLPIPSHGAGCQGYGCCRQLNESFSKIIDKFKNYSIAIVGEILFVIWCPVPLFPRPFR